MALTNPRFWFLGRIQARNASHPTPLAKNSPNRTELPQNCDDRVTDPLLEFLTFLSPSPMDFLAKLDAFRSGDAKKWDFSGVRYQHLLSPSNVVESRQADLPIKQYSTLSVCICSYWIDMFGLLAVRFADLRRLLRHGPQKLVSLPGRPFFGGKTETSWNVY